jgi:hypothetical protein
MKAVKGTVSSSITLDTCAFSNTVVEAILCCQGATILLPPKIIFVFSVSLRGRDEMP